MIRCLYLLPLLAVSILPADIDSALRECAAIPSDSRRLSCYDDLALLFDSGTMAAGQLLTHDSLAFQFMPAGARPVSMNFDTRGMARAIRPLLEACRLRISPDGILEAAD